MYKKFILYLLLVSLVSCNDLLEEKSYSSLTVDSFYNNATEGNQAVVGIYSMLTIPNYYKRALTHITGFTSDESYHPGAAFAPFDNNDLVPTNSVVTDLWNAIFNLHGRANFAVKAIENSEGISDDDKPLMLARIRFVRALNLYNAVRFWGDIPLVKEYSVDEDTWYPARTPKAEVYAYIEEDLKYCAEILPVTETNYGYPTQGAALGLLGKVYMSEEKWDDAKTVIDEVIALKVYALLDTYDEVFDIAKENNKEEIFAIQFKKDDAVAAENSLGSLLPFWYLPAFNTLGYTANPDHPKGQMRVEHATYDRYTTGDYKSDNRNLIFITQYVNSNSATGALVKRYPLNKAVAAQGPAVSKYKDPTNNNDRNYDNNLYILRYADILLMKAEVENEINDGPTDAAYAAFNEVRTRSNAVSLATGLSQDEFRDAVSSERGIELYGESQRWFDQTRMKRSNGDSYYKYWKNAVNIAAYTKFNESQWTVYYSKMELMPIPTSEMAINPNITVADQNPGY
ncbi:MAG: RagB/SusD family nutrient uptake outer membrane protein [Mangrovibacterium sp.]